VAKNNISIYIVKGNFSKVVAFKEAIRKFLNMVAAHIEGLRYPSILPIYLPLLWGSKPRKALVCYGGKRRRKIGGLTVPVAAASLFSREQTAHN
jgi:hypothetical protein